MPSTPSGSSRNQESLTVAKAAGWLWLKSLPDPTAPPAEFDQYMDHVLPSIDGTIYDLMAKDKNSKARRQLLEAYSNSKSNVKTPPSKQKAPKAGKDAVAPVVKRSADTKDRPTDEELLAFVPTMAQLATRFEQLTESLLSPEPFAAFRGVPYHVSWLYIRMLVQHEKAPVFDEKTSLKRKRSAIEKDIGHLKCFDEVEYFGPDVKAALLAYADCMKAYDKLLASESLDMAEPGTPSAPPTDARLPRERISFAAVDAEYSEDDLLGDDVEDQHVDADIDELETQRVLGHSSPARRSQSYNADTEELAKGKDDAKMMASEA